jgi:hypothetical protein
MTTPMRVVLIPGWNEGAEGMRVFAEGRNGYAGLTSLGFECVTFSGGSGSISERIDQLQAFLDGLAAGTPSTAPVGLFGYSAGGVTARGLLRAHPETPIAAVFQLAAPNAGVVVDDLALLMQRIHFEQSVIEDLDIESPFMRWLNQTGGRWTGEGRVKRWSLDRRPWIGPSGVPIASVVGRVPRYGHGDGVVRLESATLGGIIPHELVDHGSANHLNLSGAWNPLTALLRGWLPSDRWWPFAVAAAARHFGAALNARI